MNEDGVTGLDFVGALEQILRGHALQHHRRTLLERKAIGQIHQAVGGHEAHFGVGADRPGGIGHAIALFDIGHTLTDRLDHAGRFHADAARQRQGVQAGAVIDINVIEAAGAMAHARLARSGLAHLDVLPHHDLGAALFVQPDRF